MKRKVALVFALIIISPLTLAAEKKDQPKSGLQLQCTVGPAGKTGLLDINNATESQIKALPGINETYCRRIIAGRPYTKMSQLVSKKIIPKAAYDKIKDQIVIKQTKK